VSLSNPLPLGSPICRRALVLGAGFVGGEVIRRLAGRGWEVQGTRSRDLDLTGQNAWEKLSRMLRQGDTLVFVAAKAPVKTPEILVENLQMAQNVLRACQKTPPGHLVYVSSDAVYADGPCPLSEDSPAAPTSLHGVMHLTRELMMKTLHPVPLAVVRPTLIFGEEDPHNGYGPNQFLRLAKSGKPIRIFGKGEEQRDHIHVGDVAEMIAEIVVRGRTGIVNAVTGETTSFLAIAEKIRKKCPVRIEFVERLGPPPHNGYRAFAAAKTKALVPRLILHRLDEYISIQTRKE